MTKPRYYPTYSGSDQALIDELNRLSAIIGEEGVFIPTASVEPSKPTNGQVLWADGTNWDPLGTGAQALVIYSESLGDWMVLAEGTGGTPGTGVSDHGELDGLLDDDHPQYLTRTRGDALYYGLEEGTDSVLVLNDVVENVAVLQSGVEDIVNDLLTNVKPDIDTLQIVQATHTSDISDLQAVYGSTASAAASAAAAAADAATAVQAKIDALAAAADAETYRDAASGFATSAQGYSSSAAGSAQTAVNAASSATTSESNAASSAQSALDSSVSAAAWADVAQDAAQGGVTVDAAPGALWKFDSDLESWTGSNPTPTWDASGYLNQGGGTDPTLVSPTISVDGSVYSFIVFRIRRNSGSGWQGKFRYSTSGHGFSDTYSKTISEPIFVGSAFMVVSVDMSTISDWTTATITGIELQLCSDSGTSDFDIDWIAVGNDVASLAQAAAASALAAGGYADDASASAFAASQSAGVATAKAADASDYSNAAFTSKTQAAASATAASQSATAADSSKISAETAQSSAESARDAAVIAKQDAEAAEAQASSYATDAANSATDSGNSADAASTSASNAQTQADNAFSSAQAAAASAQQAATSAGASGNSATSAAYSASVASAESSAASGSAEAALLSATQAQGSAGEASSYAGQASTYRDEAVSARNAASNSATLANASAATAEEQASSATDSAAEAAASASLAATYYEKIYPINPLTEEGNTVGWFNVQDVALRSVGGLGVYAGDIASSGNTQAYTDWIEVDHGALIEISLQIAKSAVTGRFLIGVHASTNGTTVDGLVQPIKDQAVVGSPTTNPYWLSTLVGSSYAANDWYYMKLYVVGSAISAALCPDALVDGVDVTQQEWSYEYDGLQLPSNASHWRLRILNYDNAGVATSLYVTQVRAVKYNNQNSAAVKSVSTALATETSTRASQINSIITTGGPGYASVTQLSSSVDGIEAKYAVKVDVNGRVVGYELIATGASADFAIYADRFSIAIPGSPGSPPKVPFVVGTVNGVSTVGIDGSLLVDGSITAQKITTATLSAIVANLGSITAGTLTFPTNSAWHIRSGRVGATLGAGTGFWVGYESGYGVTFALGSDNEHIRWLNGQLIIKGRISPRSLTAAAHGAFTISGSVASWDTSGSEHYPSTLTVTRQAVGQYRIGWPSGWANPGYAVVVTANGTIASVANKSTTGFTIYTYDKELYFTDPPTNSQYAIRSYASDAVNVSFIVFKADGINPSGPPTA